MSAEDVDMTAATVAATPVEASDRRGDDVALEGTVVAVGEVSGAAVSDTTAKEETEAEPNTEAEVKTEVKIETKTETKAEGRTCALCAAKKPIASGCVNNACKRCCLAHSDACAAHQKSRKSDLMAAMLENPPAPDPAKAKKPVLKHEFKESNFSYYQETVTVFCVRDFFGSKKLSQGILNDQTRSQRVSGSYLGKQPKRVKGVKSPELKAAIMDVLGKRKRPEGEGTTVVAVETASG